MVSLSVSAFQINGNAILTVKEGREVVVSGGYPCVCDEAAGSAVINLGGLLLECKISKVVRDPEKHGVYPGQDRFFWEGTAEFRG